MTLIILIRHGESVSNVDGILTSADRHGYPLTSKGRDQIRLTAEELKKLKVNALFSSPLLRAKQTAEIIGKELGLEIIFDERLVERQVGDMEGLPLQNRGLWHFEEGIESDASTYGRIKSFIDEQKEGVVVAVSHSDTISTMVINLLSLDLLSGFGIRVPNGSITMVEKKNKDVKLLVLGMPAINKEFIEKVPKEFRK